MNGLLRVDPITGVRRLFYAVTPNETSFETRHDVPEYVIEAVPFFALAVIIEGIVLRYMDKGKEDRFGDSITSMISGQFMVITGLLTMSLEIGCYLYVYENWRLVNLPWDSPWTWIISFLGIDLGYYWFHRMAHEVNVLWGSHQVHHSSEEYNYTTALRQSVFQSPSKLIFYVPLAFLAPPSHYLVHKQFNTIFQFWLHTELISTLGPLEYILNTPSHHRVHHGRNRYCVDKNYAGVLIIWDRMFGTFSAERDEKIAYGLVHPLTTFETITVQFFHYKSMWETFCSTPGLMNKIKVIFYGPGWAPGKPRTGLEQDIPDVKGPEPNKYRTSIPGWLKAYILVHFVINPLLIQAYMEAYNGLSQLNAVLGMAYVIYSVTCIGMLCDQKPWWRHLAEMGRCALVFAVTTLAIHTEVGPGSIMLTLQVTFGLSLLFWIHRLGMTQTAGKEKSP